MDILSNLWWVLFISDIANLIYFTEIINMIYKIIITTSLNTNLSYLLVVSTKGHFKHYMKC